ncbi:hypothetical protein QYE76_053425 [Lolium multiflorum]|uniref:BHLH domain-containing protein n=1 Tax=Lolium multiflorum TaxID=4521 RepID=A0AAD8SVS4_LOLMU|nr:hypothetical protein QYE76_053425 [Lolium multiflorum]
MDDMWCSLDMAADIAGLHSALADPFWQPFTHSAVSSIGNDTAYFGVDDVGLMVEVDGMADMDTTGFFGGGDARFVLPPSTSSSLSSKRSLSLDSGGSSGSITLDQASRQQAPPPAPVAHQPFDHNDEAIMRAMMAVMSSGSPSPTSSASSRAQPFSRDSSMPQQAMAPHPRGGGNGGHHVMVKSSLAVSPEGSSSGSRGLQPESGNSGQLYHMMSERKRREKLNDSFLALRSLLPPCSKKDKTTVLTKAAGYLRTLEAQVSELEEKNSKLEKHIPALEEDGGTQQPRRQRAKVQISKASEEVVSLTVMVMVECDVVELVLRILECLRWMEQISVLSVDADTYSPQVLLKAIASIKLRVDGDWNEASFHEAMTKAVNDATSSPPPHAPIMLTA